MRAHVRGTLHISRILPEWIEHGILDSIVDSFFPFLEDIEQECLVIEDIAFGGKAYEEPAATPSSASSVIGVGCRAWTGNVRYSSLNFGASPSSASSNSGR